MEEKNILINHKKLGFFPDWEKIFGRNAPLFIEIGIGNGEFIIWAGQNNPQANFIGIEICKKILKKAINKIKNSHLNNIKVLHIEGIKALCKLFKENSISGIYVNFPDPWAKKKQKKRRLLNPASVWIIANRLQINGTFFLATDYKEYIETTLELFLNTQAFSPVWNPPIQTNLTNYYYTKYARKWKAQGLTLYFLSLKKISHPSLPEWLFDYYPLLKLKGGEPLPEIVFSTTSSINFEKIASNFYPLREKILFEQTLSSSPVKIKIVVKLVDIYYNPKGLLFDLIVSEGELVQRFFLKLVPHSKGAILKIHETTEPDPTDGIHFATSIIGKLCEKVLNAKIINMSCKNKIWNQVEKLKILNYNSF